MPDQHSYLSNKEKKNCTGCGACSFACKHHAIDMREDIEGFFYPDINKNLCTGCGLCIKSCPIAFSQQNTKDNREFYLATTPINEYFSKSATIGVCTMLAESIINSGGVVYGAWLDETTWKCKHICISTLPDIEKIRNSKYTQSEIHQCLRDVENNLKSGKTVLFVGTPCQIAGLKSFLFHAYNNLYTIDLICHGVYSYKILQEEVKYWGKIYNGVINNFRFRSKRVYPWERGGVINFDVTNKKNKVEHIEILGPFSPTYRCYAYSGNGINYNLRLSCYHCQFRAEERYGDITVGDSWFMKKNFPEIFSGENNRNGISLLLINTSKGHDIMNMISQKLNLFKLEKSQAFVQPALLPTNRVIPVERAELYSQLLKEDYGELVNRLLGVDIRMLYKKSISHSRESKFKKLKSLVKKHVLGYDTSNKE